MIQVLTHSGITTSIKGSNIVINKIHDAQSLDDFEINIIDLNEPNMWCQKGNRIFSIDSIADIRSLSVMIKNSRQTQIIVMFPENLVYKYDFHNGKYVDCAELKNMIYQMSESVIKELYEPLGSLKLIYENTQTNIGKEKVKAAFFFNNISDSILMKSQSGKPVVCTCGNVIATTLILQNYDHIMLFLKKLGLIKEKESAPAWIEGMQMFDDNKQLQIIEENSAAIKAANENISKAMETINKNNEYKSILYTSGEELVNVVFEILEKMLGCNLSDFVDEKNEDFLFDINGITFIGEIKGVNHNVKNENVSQLDVHYQRYIDTHEEVDLNTVKAILIMNHQKNKPLSNREPVHDHQISLAKRNGSLVIETYTLLKLFEKYLANEMTREECTEIFASNTGLLKL